MRRAERAKERRPTLATSAPSETPNPEPGASLYPRPRLVKSSVDLEHTLALDLARVLSERAPEVDLVELGLELANQAWAARG